MSKSQALYDHANERIPGGVQLLSKRPEQFAPGQWPNYMEKAKGCEVWDLDGNHYYDFTHCGVGSCLLGYADDDVENAIINKLKSGSMGTLNCPEEVQLADRLCEIHPWAEQARFCRGGGEVCAMAIRIARATTGRDLVAICGYHGCQDWYLAVNVDEMLLSGFPAKGVPSQLSQTTIPFEYEDTAAFDEIIKNYGDRLACVIMEPLRHDAPPAGFLEHVRDELHRVGALLIFDEITIGWRLTFGGAHNTFVVKPDMAVFAKAMGNGHPISAVIGTKEAMKGASAAFISSTYWTEGVGPTAALATIDKMQKTKVWEKVRHAGERVQQAWLESGERHGLKVTCSGIPCLAHFHFPEHNLELQTLYTVLMLKEGFLGTDGFYPTLAHTDEIIDLYASAIDRVFAKIAEITKSGSLEDILAAIGGPVRGGGFQRLVK